MEDRNKTQQTDEPDNQEEKIQEQERIRKPKATLIIMDPEREQHGSQYFSYLMLLLGVVVGAVLGATLYFVNPGPGLSRQPDSQQLAVIEGLDAADQLLESGRFEPARKAYLSVISEHPESPQPYNNLALLYAAEGDFDQAQILLNRALETDQVYLTVYKNVGMVYAAMARDSYGKALQLEGKQRQVHLLMLKGEPTVPVVAQHTTGQPELIASSAVAVNPVEVKPAEVKPAEVKPAEVKPAEVKPAEVKPAEVKPAEVKPAEVVMSKPLVAQDLAISDPGVGVSPQQFLNGWALAWSAQDLNGYLKSYAIDFKPEGSLSRSAWSVKRKKRLAAPKYIKVKLEALEVLSETEKSANVQAIQSYRSDRFSDRSRKSFILKRDGQSWLIAEERSLGQVR